MKNDDLNQALADTYFSGIYDTLDSLMEAAKGSIDAAKEMGIDNPEIGYKEVLESFKKLKELANERQNSGCRMGGNTSN